MLNYQTIIALDEREGNKNVVTFEQCRQGASIIASKIRVFYNLFFTFDNFYILMVDFVTEGNQCTRLYEREYDRYSLLFYKFK